MKHNNYEEIIDMLVGKMTEYGIQEQRESTPEINMLIKNTITLSLKVKKVLDELDKESKELLVQYHEQSEKIADMQIKHLYIQGAKDCVLLLKELGVFNL